jgi:hypothetical protein
MSLLERSVYGITRVDPGQRPVTNGAATRVGVQPGPLFDVRQTKVVQPVKAEVVDR